MEAYFVSPGRNSQKVSAGGVRTSKDLTPRGDDEYLRQIQSFTVSFLFL